MEDYKNNEEYKNNTDVTEKMIDYIVKNNISIEQTSKDTQISASKLRGETRDRLMAAEFLRLCQYLGVQPQDFK